MAHAGKLDDVVVVGQCGAHRQQSLALPIYSLVMILGVCKNKVNPVPSLSNNSTAVIVDTENY